ncbi:MAG: DnaJ domain-containing protein [Rhodothalassiaceae bacterium]
MAWFFIGLALLLLLVAALYWLAYSEPQRIGRAVAAVILILLAILVIALALSGRLAASLPGLLALGWGLLGWKRLVSLIAARASWFRPDAEGGSGAAPQRSTVRTAWLEMVLDHDNHSLDGTVLQGAAAGRRLSDMSLDELLALHAVLSEADADSRRLLEAYLDRVHGAEWRAAGGTAHRQEAPSTDASGMTDAEALAILGLAPGADREAIRKAHRRLMQKLHPDHGGSDYFAAKINAAKEHLLRRR